MMKLNELFTDAQPEADSAAIINPLLPLFIALKYTAQCLLIHTGSCIGNMNEHLLALRFS
ncbi:hypothetical protein D3C73_1445650 [compost metagenome]